MRPRAHVRAHVERQLASFIMWTCRRCALARTWNAQQAAVEVEELLFRGHPEVVDADLPDYLEAASYCPPAYEVTSNSVG